MASYIDGQSPLLDESTPIGTIESEQPTPLKGGSNNPDLRMVEWFPSKGQIDAAVEAAKERDARPGQER